MHFKIGLKIDTVQAIYMAPPTKLVHGDRRSFAYQAVFCMHPPIFSGITKINKYIF